MQVGAPRESRSAGSSRIARVAGEGAYGAGIHRLFRQRGITSAVLVRVQRAPAIFPVPMQFRTSPPRVHGVSPTERQRRRCAASALPGSILRSNATWIVLPTRCMNRSNYAFYAYSRRRHEGASAYSQEYGSGEAASRGEQANWSLRPEFLQASSLSGWRNAERAAIPETVTDMKGGSVNAARGRFHQHGLRRQPTGRLPAGTVHPHDARAWLQNQYMADRTGTVSVTVLPAQPRAGAEAMQAPVSGSAHASNRGGRSAASSPWSRARGNPPSGRPLPLLPAAPRPLPASAQPSPVAGPSITPARPRTSLTKPFTRGPVDRHSRLLVPERKP